MALIRVTAGELKSRAEELRNLNTQFKTSVDELEALEGNLVGMWEGEARNAFHNVFQSDKSQMMNFYNAIEQYVARLEAAAARYEQAESMNLEIANTRKYQ